MWAPGDLAGERMKLVIAVISPDKFETLKEALREPDAYVLHANLIGDLQEPILIFYRGGSHCEPRIRLRIEIVIVNELLLDEVLDVIFAAASSENAAQVSNGNVFVLPLEQWVRIPAHRSPIHVTADR